MYCYEFAALCGPGCGRDCRIGQFKRTQDEFSGVRISLCCEGRRKLHCGHPEFSGGRQLIKIDCNINPFADRINVIHNAAMLVGQQVETDRFLNPPALSVE